MSCLVQERGSAAAAEARDSMVDSLGSYQAPALLVTLEELHSLLKEAKRVDALISGRPVEPEVCTEHAIWKMLHCVCYVQCAQRVFTGMLYVNQW